MAGESKKIDISTGVGTLSFPRLFEDTKGKKDDGVTDVYDVQIIIPKSQRDDIKALALAIREVGKAKWGDNYSKMTLPLRDGDKEADDICEDGKTPKREKYPERLGAYFMNCRSSRPVSVVGRDRTPIVNSGEVYGGCKAKVNVTFYTYNAKGNQGIAAGLNGVQFIAHGEPFGNGAPTVDSMFDILDDEEDAGLDEGTDPYADPEPEPEPEPEPTPAPAAKKTAAKKTAAAPLTAAQKKARAARLAAEAAAAEAEAEAEAEGADEENPDLAGLGGDDDADGLYDDLDDSNA